MNETTYGQLWADLARAEGHVSKVPSNLPDGPTSKTADTIERILSVMSESEMTSKEIANKMGWKSDGARYYLTRAVRIGYIVKTGLARKTLYRKVTP